MTRKRSAPEYAKVLVASTAHIGATLATGDDPPMNGFASMTGKHGWFIHVGAPRPMADNEPAALQVLRDLLHYARQHGCAYVLFDSDGPTLKQFPTYGW
jgi:hypothetical protein